MRPQTKKGIRNSTTAERAIIECLKELHIPFEHKWWILHYEVDFLVGDYIIEVDGRKLQSEKRNKILLEAGYNLIHISNLQAKERSQIKAQLEKIYGN